jgi:hypothetical protein
LSEVVALAMTVGSMKIRLLFDDLAQPGNEGVSEVPAGNCAPGAAPVTGDPPARGTRFT